jgi:hypothetical protein
MSIVNFSPENTPDKLYIYSGFGNISFSDLLDSIKNHFGEDIDLSALTITPEHIHTRCITYDLHDPSDYDDYLVIERCK